MGARQRGIEDHGGYIRIGFNYKGKYRREPLGIPATPANFKYAAKFRAKVLLAITADEFDYAEYFPNSRRAQSLSAPNTQTLGECYKAWLGERRREKSTLRGYGTAYRRLMRPLPDTPAFRPDTNMGDITLSWIRRWATSASEQFSAKSVNNSLIILRGAFNVAHESGSVADNLPKRLKNLSNPPRRDLIDPFTREEVEAIIAANPGEPANLVETWFCCGFRPGEIMALTWGDVDLQHRQLQVRSNFVLGEIKSTKTGGQRTIRLTHRPIGALKKQRLVSAFQNRVFLNPNTGEPWGGDQALRKNFVRWCKAAGVRPRPPKCLRHTYISLSLAGGMSPFKVAKQAGHTDLKMMMDHYAAWIPDEDFEAQHSAIFG